MTIEEMRNQLNTYIRQGLGGHEILLSSDEEGNHIKHVDEITIEIRPDGDDVVIWPK